jgi:hypothetical protein
LCYPPHGASALCWPLFWALCWYPDVGRKMVLRGPHSYLKHIRLRSAEVAGEVEHGIAQLSEGLLSRLCRGWRWRAGPRPDLPYLGQLDQLIGGDSEPVFFTAAGHSKVIGTRLARAHRAEQCSVDAFDCGIPLAGAGLRREDDYQ